MPNLLSSAFIDIKTSLISASQWKLCYCLEDISAQQATALLNTNQQLVIIITPTTPANHFAVHFKNIRQQINTLTIRYDSRKSFYLTQANTTTKISNLYESISNLVPETALENQICWKILNSKLPQEKLQWHTKALINILRQHKAILQLKNINRIIELLIKIDMLKDIQNNTFDIGTCLLMLDQLERRLTNVGHTDRSATFNILLATFIISAKAHEEESVWTIDLLFDEIGTTLKDAQAMERTHLIELKHLATLPNQPPQLIQRITDLMQYVEANDIPEIEATYLNYDHSHHSYQIVMAILKYCITPQPTRKFPHHFFSSRTKDDLNIPVKRKEPLKYKDDSLIFTRSAAHTPTPTLKK